MRVRTKASLAIGVLVGMVAMCGGVAVAAAIDMQRAQAAAADDHEELQGYLRFVFSLEHLGMAFAHRRLAPALTAPQHEAVRQLEQTAQTLVAEDLAEAEDVELEEGVGAKETSEARWLQVQVGRLIRVGADAPFNLEVDGEVLEALRARTSARLIEEQRQVELADDLLRTASRRLLVVVVLGPMALVLTLAFLVMTFARPLLKAWREVSRAMERIGAGQLDVPIVEIGNDELTAVSRGFNRMALNLREGLGKRDEAQRAARAVQADIAEIATGVLHNVGNILTISGAVLSERAGAPTFTKLARVCDLLDSATGLGPFLTEDARGKMVPAYLRALSEELLTLQAGIAAEASGVRLHSEHIRNVITAQQSFAQRSAHQEATSIPELIDSALQLGASHARGLRLEVDVGPLPTVILDQHRTLQILLNLLSNARHAIHEAGVDDGVVQIRACQAGSELQLMVTDNGNGIAPENLDRVFRFGFTTKRDGHGFGLHSAAIAAKEMGGHIGCASPGRGQGATFTLMLPLVVAAHVEETMTVRIAPGRASLTGRCLSDDPKQEEQRTAETERGQHEAPPRISS